MELIAKKYRILKSLGVGAMGEVFLVLPPRGDPVALKLLKGLESESADAAISQFENEFKVLKKLSHPNIGKIFDYGFDEELKKVFFTSPWLKGSDLFVATADLSFEKCEEYFVQVLRAVNYLHQKGIIHCDLKPGNIFVEAGTVQIIDFGLAGYWGESIVGTPTFLAPEIYRGEHHSVTSDLYAIGVILYACLTKSQPFSGATLQEVYDRHRTYTPTPISILRPDVPKYFSDIVSTLLAKKPEERYQSAVAVIDEIGAFSKTKYSVETSETLLSYLPTTSELIGRKEIQWRVGNLVRQFLNPKNNTHYYGLYVHGDRGLGKSKFVHQIKSELQLEKITVEQAWLPLGEAEKRVLETAKAIIFEDIDQFMLSAEGRANIQVFLSFLEQKILSPQTSRFLFIASGTNPAYWNDFKRLFPQEDFLQEAIPLVPLTEEETRAFLESIIGNKEMPPRFVTEIYRNTAGNPGLLTQTVESLIQQGLLFDKSGRWSSDLLVHLADAIRKVELPQSLEEQMQRDYSKLNAEEREISHWLCLSLRGLGEKNIERLTKIPKISRLLKKMCEQNFLRIEQNNYVFYRSVFGPFVSKQMPLPEQRRRHTAMSQLPSDIDQEEIWYHQSLGDDLLVAQSALESLAQLVSQQGRKEEALDYFQRLTRTYFTAPLMQRLQWTINMADILIWLNRFAEVEELLGKIEVELENTRDAIPPRLKMTVMEKKGLALLHQEKIIEARHYFEKGYNLARADSEAHIEMVRFLNDLAQIETITGHPEKAIEIFIRARELYKNLTRQELSWVTNNDLGHVYHQIREYDKAIDLLEKDVILFSELQNREPLVRALYTLAESYRALKKYRKAIKEYEKCIKLCQEENLFAILLRAYNGLGNIYLAEGDNAQALASYQKAIEISIHLKDPTTKAALLANQGLIYRKEKNWPQATRRFLLAKQTVEEKGAKFAYEHHLISKCYDELTNIAKESKDMLKALTFQLERQQVVDHAEVLSSERFDVRLNVAELYLENRLGDSFNKEINAVEKLAGTPEEKRQVAALKDKWMKIQSFDQETTMKV